MSYFNYNEAKALLRAPLNYASLVCAAVVPLSAIYYCQRRGTPFARMMVKMQIYIALANIVRHLCILYQHEIENDAYCSLVGFIYSSTTLTYLFYNSVIVINSHITVLCQFFPRRRWYHAYWYAGPIFALIISSRYGDNSVLGRPQAKPCEIQSISPYSNNVMIYFIFIPLFIYCIVISLLTCKVMCYDVRREADTILEYVNEPRNRWLVYMVKAALQILRVHLAPLACVITLSGFIASNVYISLYGECSEILNFWSFFGLSITGMLHLFTLLFDYGVQIFFNHQYKTLRVIPINQRQAPRHRNRRVLDATETTFLIKSRARHINRLRYTQNVQQNLSNPVIEIAPEIEAPEVDPIIFPEIAPESSPDSTSDPIQEATSEPISESTPETTPDLATEHVANIATTQGLAVASSGETIPRDPTSSTEIEYVNF